jgi:hypothetical protein
MLQILPKYTLLLAFTLMATQTVVAQNIAHFFEKFPYKQESVSLTASPTNLVVMDTQHNYIRVTSALKTETTVQTTTTTVQTTITAVQTTTTVFMMFTNAEGLQHFAYQTAEDDGKGNGCLKSVTKLYVVQDDGEWKDVTAQLVPSLRLSEFYGKKNVPNFIDVNGVISSTREHNRDGIGLGVALELPQLGTTLLARLLPRCQTAVLPEYALLLAECKFKTIELLWDPKNTWFIIGKKFEK